MMRDSTLVFLLSLVCGSVFANGYEKKSNPVCQALTNISRSKDSLSTCEDITAYIDRQTRVFGSDDPSMWEIPMDVARNHLYEVLCRPPKDDCPHLLEALVKEVKVTPVAGEIAEVCKLYAQDSTNNAALRRYCVSLAIAGKSSDREWLLKLLTPEQLDWGWLLREVYSGIENTPLASRAIGRSILIASIAADTHAREVAGSFYLAHKQLLDPQIREALFFAATQGCSIWSLDQIGSSYPQAIDEIEYMCDVLNRPHQLSLRSTGCTSRVVK